MRLLRAFGFTIRREAARPKLVATHSRGVKGRWRWYLRAGNVLVAEAPIGGFDSYEDSVRAVEYLTGGFDVEHLERGDG